jgi:hypothetical protein
MNRALAERAVRSVAVAFTGKADMPSIADRPRMTRSSRRTRGQCQLGSAWMDTLGLTRSSTCFFKATIVAEDKGLIFGQNNENGANGQSRGLALMIVF